jgi:tryptophan-rich sensory protein
MDPEGSEPRAPAGRISMSEVNVPWLRDLIGLLVFLALCFGTAALGSRLSDAALREWYADLAKPPWTPPDWVFGPVWAVLYPLVAVAGWTVWREGRSRIAVPLFLLQLALNAVWPWLFFGFRRPGWAFLDIVALLASIVATMAAFQRVRRRAALLLVPYLAWVTFAAALNLAIWQMNPL